MTAKPVFETQVDLSRNLVHTRYSGRLTATDMQSSIVQVKAILVTMKPGFSILSDWSQLETMGLDCVPHLTEIMDLCAAYGAATIVRVLPDPSKDIGINILSAIHLRGKVRTLTCETLEEAEQALK